MSAIITGRLFWTEFQDLAYTNKNGKEVKVKETTAKIVMLAIGDSADDYGENSWQSFETIAKKTSIQRRSVMRVIRALIVHDYLKLAGVTTYGTNNYSINLDHLGDPPKARAKTGRPKSGDSESESGDSESESGDPESESGDPESESGDPESPDPSLIHPDPSLNSNGEKPKFRTAEWDLYHGITPEPTQDELDLQRIYKTWTAIMKDDPDWSRWGTFDKWLLQKERAGQPVVKFCRWFMSDEFRAKTIGMWSPSGSKENKWSFKRVFPQAFERPGEVEPEPDDEKAARIAAAKKLVEES